MPLHSKREDILLQVGPLLPPARQMQSQSAAPRHHLRAGGDQDPDPFHGSQTPHEKYSRRTLVPLRAIRPEHRGVHSHSADFDFGPVPAVRRLHNLAARVVADRPDKDRAGHLLAHSECRGVPEFVGSVQAERQVQTEDLRGEQRHRRREMRMQVSVAAPFRFVAHHHRFQKIEAVAQSRPQIPVTHAQREQKAGQIFSGTCQQRRQMGPNKMGSERQHGEGSASFQPIGLRHLPDRPIRFLNSDDVDLEPLRAQLMYFPQNEGMRGGGVNTHHISNS